MPHVRVVWPVFTVLATVYLALHFFGVRPKTTRWG